MGQTRIRHRNGRLCMIGTNAMSIWGRPDKRMAGNAPCPLRPKTEPPWASQARILEVLLARPLLLANAPVHTSVHTTARPHFRFHEGVS